MKRNLRIIVVFAIVLCLLSTSVIMSGCSQATPSGSSAAPASSETVSTPAASASASTAASAAASGTGTSASASSASVADLVQQCSKLSGIDALKFFESLSSKGLSDNDIIQFFIDLPISQANADIYKLYNDEGFETYGKSYPAPNPYDNFVWQKGSGTEIVGPFSKLNLKLPFTDYVPLPEGPIGDPNKTYNIGVAFHGFNHPWLIDWADAAQWEANRHPNVKLSVLDGEFDDNKQAQQMDTFIAQKMDGILIWPQVEAPTGPPVERALQAGIPVVSSDRLTGASDITSRVTGNFPANGAQDGAFLVYKLAQESNDAAVKANIVMLRKPLGSTADAVRTGHFLKVLSYFPDIKILNSYHDPDNREQAFVNAQTALQAYPNIDAFFGTGDHEALAAFDAVTAANRANSREGGKKILYISIDDSKEALGHVKTGDFEVNTPYTPLQSDIAMRVLLKILSGTKMPQDVTTPNIPMVTTKGDVVFGIHTQTVDDWYQYTFGPPMTASASPSAQ